jgi:heme oxygenase
MTAAGAIDRPAGEIRALLRDATHDAHERLHHHPGFSRVKDGTISRPDYQVLLVRLYGFYLPFDRAIGAEPARTQWLASDLASLGVDIAANPGMPVCTAIPAYHAAERRLGALYVVEGSALGGRQLCRGLDRLLGKAAIEGRRFFAGRGADTGAAWTGYLDRLAAVAPEPACQAALIAAATETFTIFEDWLGGWDTTS